MPRRGRSGGMSRAPAPAPVPARTYAPPPAPAPVMAQPKQPGMFAQMATTAAGVAVGSAIGHTVGAAITGSMSGGGNSHEVAAAPAPVQQAPPAQNQQKYDNNPCQHHLQQFLECTQTQPDISLCTGFNEALKECKLRFGIA